ncbi:hypothetical protein POPTR_002G207950v4 [Populus trichocarpa]|jgi:hypothetical protein|uniref:Uncharacterized protein n=1 Tax=Populus trichocarpa TaxID=3694 RepID=A0ACC0TFC6_POPTR|nr:hypothetical protein BDE02_02G191300 [Populus trichocarpa]KAI9400246.1 hypothetical protein POPTR_002G207950v4 [Populus trichocarpa]
MGKVVCTELHADHGLDFDFMGLVMALVIALALMAICFQPPRRTLVLHRIA